MSVLEKEGAGHERAGVMTFNFTPWEMSFHTGHGIEDNMYSERVGRRERFYAPEIF